jgi:hypothetical protein
LETYHGVDWLRGGIFSDNLFIHGFFILRIALFIVTLLVFKFRRSRNELACRSIVSELVSPLLAFGLECRIGISGSTGPKSFQRIKVDALIPRVDEP